MNMKKLAGVLILIMLVISLSGCVSSVYRGPRYDLQTDGDAEEEQVVPDGVAMPLFYGIGTGSTEEKAADDAVRDALQRAAVIALQESGLVYKDQVSRILKGITGLDAYRLSSSQQLLDWDYDRGTYTALVSVRLQLGKLSELLRKQGIYGGLIQDSISLRLPNQDPIEYEDAASLDDVLEDSIIDWSDGIKPTFLVYYDEKQVSDPFTSRTAVLTANRYLSSIDFTYIDLSQIESIKQDQEYAFAEETGSSSMLRWIASRLHADYYIDVAVSTSSYERGGSYYAEASVSLSCFEASTAEGRGSVFIQTEDPVQGNTRTAAVDGAVAKEVSRGMLEIMNTASRYFTDDAGRGTPYELIMMKTYDDKMIRSFQKLLAEQVGSLVRTSFSVEESRYTIVFDGTVDDLADLVYETAEFFPELDGIYLTYQRGNSLTFNTGM